MLARVLPRWLAELRSILARNKSLRYRARNRLARLRPEKSANRYKSRAIRARIWLELAHPIPLPLFVLAVTTWLAIWDPRGSIRVPIIANSEAARDALGRMWQVEGAVLALITAAALFSFESLARFREEVPLREYAARSRLPQFLMLGASGLLSVGIALLWSDDHVPAAAAGWALSVSMLGLAAVPFLFHHA